MRRMHSIEGSLYIEREQDYACDSAGMIGDVRFDSRQNPTPAPLGTNWSEAALYQFALFAIKPNRNGASKPPTQGRPGSSVRL